MKPGPLLGHARALLGAYAPQGVSADALERVLARGRLGRARDGAVVLREGTAGDAMYFLLEGSVRVRQRDLEGQLRDLARPRAPSLLGQMALIDGAPRSARCVADGEVLLVELPRSEVATLLGARGPEGAALRRLLLRSLVLQLDRGNARLRALLRDPATGPVVAASRARCEEDVSVSDLLEITGALDGWHVRDADLASMAVVTPDPDDA